MKDVVIGVDASTTAVKAIAFDRSGRELFQSRHGYPLSNPLPGHFEQDAEHWWTALVCALKDVASRIGEGRITALCIAHQRETFTLIDAAGKPLVPAILWLDERARPQVARLSAELGREAIREWSGKPPDPTPAFYAIAWLAEHRPEVLEKAASLVDVNSFLVHRLTGNMRTSTASADPLGILATGSGQWHERLVAATGLGMHQLPALDVPGAVSGQLDVEAARLTGLAEGLPVIAGVGDGQAMGLGMAVVDEGSTYLSLGSGVVSGAFSARYVTADAFRTMTAPSGGFLLETVLRSGMQLVDWTVRTVGAGSASELEKEAAFIAPGSSNLVLMPYWSGVMSPYWDEAARGAILGLSLDHKPAHLFRATLEGIAYEQALATEAMEATMERKSDTMIAAGGGTNSKLLLDIIAAVLDRPLLVSPVNEAAALGAAMLAASAVGWYPDAKAAALAMAAPPKRRIDPDRELAQAYRQRLAIYRDIYGATRDLHRRLADLG